MHTGTGYLLSFKLILMLMFSHQSMLIRSALAAIDHNSNTDREQAKTTSGIPRFDLVKQRHGKKYHVRPIKEAKNNSWRHCMASLVIKVKVLILINFFWLKSAFLVHEVWICPCC